MEYPELQNLNERERYLATLSFISSAMQRSKRKMKILDIGCDTGQMSMLFDRIGLEVSCTSATELPPETDKLFTRKHITFKKCILPYDSLPFPPDTFDFVYMGALFEHIPSAHKMVLEDVKRVMKGGGYLIIETPNLANISNRLLLLMGRPVSAYIEQYYNDDNWIGHFREFTLGEMKAILGYSGYEVVESKMFNFMPLIRHKGIKKFLILGATFIVLKITSFIPSARQCIWIVGQKTKEISNGQ
ncbi:class I SAM-dependent methyltransferase [Chloroflexota bacterium]